MSAAEAGSERGHEPYVPTDSPYSGCDFWGPGDDVEEDADDQIVATARKIRSLYESGHPFLTKTVLQDLDRQLKSGLVMGETLLLTGLDGALVEHKVETGRIFPSHYRDMERVLVAPTINYMYSGNMITPPHYYPYMPRLAYCNLRLRYERRIRNKISKEIPTPPLPSCNDVLSYFRSVQNVWNESEACLRLKAIIEPATSECHQIIGFALGSVTWEFRQSWPQRSSFQHALLLSLRESLRSCQPDKGKIACFAQDPIYTEPDKALLTACGINLANDPEGFIRVDNSSIVVSCSPNVPVKEIVSELAFPAMIIWDTVKESTPPMPRTDPDTPRIRKMLHTNYDRVDFPGEEINFGHLSVYIRRW